jgi:hypothetical protein
MTLTGVAGDGGVSGDDPMPLPIQAIVHSAHVDGIGAGNQLTEGERRPVLVNPFKLPFQIGSMHPGDSQFATQRLQPEVGDEMRAGRAILERVWLGRDLGSECGAADGASFIRSGRYVVDERVDAGFADIRIRGEVCGQVEKWMGVAGLQRSVLDEMDQGVEAGAGHIRILTAIVDGIEEGVRVGSGLRAGTEEMEHWIQAGLGYLGMVSEIERGVEQRMRAAAFESAMFYEMAERIFSGFSDVGVSVEIEGWVKELEQQLLFLRIGRLDHWNTKSAG